MQTIDFKYFRSILELIWDKSTSFKNGEKGKSRGQCYSTALLINSIHGGEIVHGWVKFNGKREHHFWNQFEDEIIGTFQLDFTSDQYNGDGIHPIMVGQVYDKPNFNNKKFLKLKEKYIAINM